MNFKPKTEEEIQRSRLLPKGAYPFSVAESNEQASKSVKNAGRMMVALKLVIHANNGDVFHNDYFADWFSEHKLRHFAESIGKLADYEKGTLDFTQNKFQGAAGYLFLGEQTRKDTGDLQNTVKDYITKKDYDAETKAVAVASEPPGGADDDVPF